MIWLMSSTGDWTTAFAEAEGSVGMAEIVMAEMLGHQSQEFRWLQKKINCKVCLT